MNRRQLLISENEKKDILKMYNLLKEEETSTGIPKNLEEAKARDADLLESFRKRYSKFAAQYDEFFGRVFELLGSEKKKHASAKRAAQITLDNWFGDIRTNPKSGKMSELVNSIKYYIDACNISKNPDNQTEGVKTFLSKIGDPESALKIYTNFLRLLESMMSAGIYINKFYEGQGDEGLTKTLNFILTKGTAVKTWSPEESKTYFGFDGKKQQVIVYKDNLSSFLSPTIAQKIIDRILKDPNAKTKQGKKFIESAVILKQWGELVKLNIISNAFTQAEEKKKKVKNAIFIKAEPGGVEWVSSETKKVKDEVLPTQSPPITEVQAYPSQNNKDPMVQNFFEDDQYVVRQDKIDGLTNMLTSMVNDAKAEGKILSVTYRAGSATSKVPTSFPGKNKGLTNARLNALKKVMFDIISANPDLKGVPVKEGEHELLIEIGPDYDKKKYGLNIRKSNPAIEAEYNARFGPFRGSWGEFAIMYQPSQPVSPGQAAEYDTSFTTGTNYTLEIAWWKPKKWRPFKKLKNRPKGRGIFSGPGYTPTSKCWDET